MKKIKVAVTGNIGSGKSSFCRFLEEMGYTVIKADEISKLVMNDDSKIKAEIIKQFGNLAYDKNRLNKKYLATKVFSDPIKLERINSIVHPAVIKKVGSLMDKCLQTSNIVFHEAALIYEADIENKFDFIVLISADYKVRMERKKLYDNFSEDEFVKRESNQISEEEKKKRADFVFTNNGTVQELKSKAELLNKILTAIVK